jgi:hypothetical protein
MDDCLQEVLLPVRRCCSFDCVPPARQYSGTALAPGVAALNERHPVYRCRPGPVIDLHQFVAKKTQTRTV